MKSLGTGIFGRPISTLLGVFLFCSSIHGQVYVHKDFGADPPLFMMKSNQIYAYEGMVMNSVPELTFADGKIFAYSKRDTPLFVIRGNQMFEGYGEGEPMYTLLKDRLMEGYGKGDPLYTADANFIYKGFKGDRPYFMIKFNNLSKLGGFLSRTLGKQISPQLLFAALLHEGILSLEPAIPEPAE